MIFSVTRSMKQQLVFVYGTLRRGSAGAMAVRFPGAKFRAEATVKGSLYDLGALPGLLLDGASTSVIGEVYEVDDGLLKKLDEFEASSYYLRKAVEITFADRKCAGWAYEPDPEFYAPGTLIPSGNWIEYEASGATISDELPS